MYRHISLIVVLLFLGAVVFGQTQRQRSRRTTSSEPSSAAKAPTNEVTRVEATRTTDTAAVTSVTRAARVSPVNETEEAERAIKAFETAADGDLRIGYSLQGPAGYYEFDGSTLAWRRAGASDSHYLAIAVQDAGTRWLLTGCKVSATLTDSRGKDTSLTLTEVWDPHFRHYGTNFTAPSGSSTGSLSIKVEPSSIRRRDKVLGAFFTSAATAKFSAVDLTTATLPKREASTEPETPIWPAGRRPYATPRP